MKQLNSRWTFLLLANVLAWSVLGFYQLSAAQSKAPQLPFANSNEQRSEIVQELREIKTLLKESNEILRAHAANAVPNKPSK